MAEKPSSLKQVNNETVYREFAPSIPDISNQSDERDGVFGDQSEGTVQYASVSWMWTSIFLIKTQLGIGVLTIPSALHTLGLVPGVLCILALAIITTWTDFTIGRFKVRHPEVYSLSDAGRLMFGPVGEWTFAIATWFFMTFVAGSAIISLSVAFNALSLHGLCTAGFVAISAVLMLIVAVVPRLEELKWLSWLGVMTIVPAILLVTIGVAVGGRPSAAPQTGPFDLDVHLFASPTFAQAMGAVSNLVFSFAGTPIFLPIASEMKRPQDFGKAVMLCQSFVTSMYLAVGTVVYWYAGQYVASPALGTAGVLIKRIAYGLSLPGLAFTGILYVHLSGKWVFIRAMRNSYHLNHPTPKFWIVWIACCTGCCIFSYVIASAIPVFSGLVGLVGALFGTFLSLNAEACMWLYDHYPRFRDRATRTWKVTLMVGWNVFINVAGAFLIVAGTYGSCLSIRDEIAAGGSSPWSCADNSNSS
ncbi:hypothetical protein JCM10207_003373 [Rhodosporidiobolus poonsookiae]